MFRINVSTKLSIGMATFGLAVFCAQPGHAVGTWIEGQPNFVSATVSCGSGTGSSPDQWGIVWTFQTTGISQGIPQGWSVANNTPNWSCGGTVQLIVTPPCPGQGYLPANGPGHYLYAQYYTYSWLHNATMSSDGYALVTGPNCHG